VGLPRRGDGTIVPLLDLTREYQTIRAEVEESWAATLAQMHLLKGPHADAFEHEISAYLGTAGACGVGSGTDALILGLLALDVGPADEVIIQANAFVAAIEAVRSTGAQPVIVDIDPEGLGPDVDQVARALTPRTKAIIAVHMYGAPLDLAALCTLARQRDLWVLEDASHAPGAARDGRKVGTVGDLGCFSAGVVKNLGAYGDAGFVTSGDAARVARVRLLRSHGQERKNEHVVYGLNSRLDELQAAVLRIKLRHLDARNRRRREIAAYYTERFASLEVRTPRERPGEMHVYHQYVVRTPHRAALQQHLKAAGVETGIHYPVPLHRQPAFLRSYGETPSLPHAEQLAREVLSLPVFPDLSDAESEYVADHVVEFFRGL